LQPEKEEDSNSAASQAARLITARTRWQSDVLSEKVDWQMSGTMPEAIGIPGIVPLDARRTCAKLCRAAGGELEQIQLLLGHASVQTTERYLGTKQDLVHAPNDAIKLRLVV
jgi:integrase